MNIKKMTLPMLAAAGLGLSGCADNVEYVAKKAVKNDTTVSARSFEKFEKSQPNLWTQFTANRVRYWTKIEDSLKWKGAADSAYHKGAQMVRDSVSAAQKVK